MFLKVDPSSGLPIYLQIVNQIRFAVSSGELKPDGKLPSVREAALLLRINPNTVSKAYTLLEYEGIINSKRGDGTFISSSAQANPDLKNKALAEKLTEAAKTARSLGISPEETAELLEIIFRNLKPD